MQQYRISVDGGQIAVYESAGRGHPILFVHGNSASGLTFRNQLDGDLGRKHRVVAFDLPGHGGSAHPQDPQSTYSLPGLARVLDGVIIALEIPEAVLVGWSLGGHVVMEAAEGLADVPGFVLFGAPPLGKPPSMEEAFGTHPAMGAMFGAEADRQIVASLIGSFFSTPSPAAEKELIEMWLNTDGNARALLGQSFGAGNYTDELRIVERFTRPFALLQGDGEWLVRREYLESVEIPTLWRGAIQSIPAAAHAVHMENPTAFNRLLEEFVLEATSGSEGGGST